MAMSGVHLRFQLSHCDCMQPARGSDQRLEPTLWSILRKIDQSERSLFYCARLAIPSTAAVVGTTVRLSTVQLGRL
jgi:hypothetical protein